MLKMIFLSIFFLNVHACFAHSVGDYRTIPDFSIILEEEGLGYWSNLQVWQRYDGVTWTTPTPIQGYPGENAVPGVVTLNSGSRVLLDVSVQLGSLYSSG